MNLEFHYYTTAFLAKQAGFSLENAMILANSCQLVDDHVLSYEIKTNKEILTTQPTQNYGFWNKETSIDVYIPLHFFPGDSNKTSQLRKDGEGFPMAASPNNSGVKHLMKAAFKSKNLYRMGVALHTFADSWAHSGFSGTTDSLNSISQQSLLPAIGHAQAMRSPDRYDKVWNDPRLLEPKVDNRKRFFRAAKKIYRYLCIFQGREFSDEELILDFWSERMNANLQGEGWRERMLEFEIEDGIPRFQRGLWLKEALGEGATHGLTDEFTSGYSKALWLLDELVFKTKIGQKKKINVDDGFYHSNYFHWYQAARMQIQAAWTYLDQHLPHWRDNIS